MKVAHRLYLTVVPAVLGVLTVAGLAYWGRYERSVPSILVIVATLAAVGSLGLSWVNARYVAQRIERLAGGGLMPERASHPPDELDAIEGVVDHLSSAVAVAEADRSESERQATVRAKDYATMLATITASSAERLEEVRLPLHILLENHFGDLNENQEEMLGAARAAAEAIDADLVALRQIAELDLGTRELRHDRLLPGDMVRALVPSLQAFAEQAGVTLGVDIEPLVPAIHVDQPLVQDALVTILGEAIRHTAAGAELHLSLTRRGQAAHLALDGGHHGGETVKLALARRIVTANRGALDWQPGNLSVTFSA